MPDPKGLRLQMLREAWVEKEVSNAHGHGLFSQKIHAVKVTNHLCLGKLGVGGRP